MIGKYFLISCHFIWAVDGNFFLIWYHNHSVPNKYTEAYIMKAYFRHRSDGWKSISCAISMAIALTVLTACGGIDQPDPADSPENSKNFEA